MIFDIQCTWQRNSKWKHLWCRIFIIFSVLGYGSLKNTIIAYGFLLKTCFGITFTKCILFCNCRKKTIHFWRIHFWKILEHFMLKYKPHNPLFFTSTHVSLAFTEEYKINIIKNVYYNKMNIISNWIRAHNIAKSQDGGSKV